MRYSWSYGKISTTLPQNCGKVYSRHHIYLMCRFDFVASSSAHFSFSYRTPNVLNVLGVESFKDIKIDELQSCGLKNEFPLFRFLEYFNLFFDEDSENQWTGFYMIGASVMKELKTTTFKESFVINHRHNKSRVKFSNWKRFNNELVPS